MRVPLSVAMISYNEEPNIGQTIEAVASIASEIVVVDSHSTDATREIAAAAGARVFEEDWKGYIAQKNSALEKCTEPWILALDCDEIVSPALRDGIVAAVQVPRADGYLVNRRTVYLGRPLAHMWQPDWKLRLVKRDAKPVWGGYDPHDSLQIEGATAKLRGGFLDHVSYRDLEDHFRRIVRYARISAMSYHERGKRSGVGKIVFSPAAALAKALIVKGAPLDGVPGLVAAGSTYVAVFFKYCFLWELEHRSPHGDGDQGGTS